VIGLKQIYDPTNISRNVKIFGLGVVLGLVLCWPHSCKGCPRGLVVSHRYHVIYITFFFDRKLLLALIYSVEVNFSILHWHCLRLPYWVWILGIDNFYVGMHAFIYNVFITHATSLASASASLFPGLVNIPEDLSFDSTVTVRLKNLE